MPLYRRIARRGFSNYPFKTEYVPINLSEIDTRYKSGETVSLETLRTHGLISKNQKLVKILGDGEIKKKLSIVGLKVSASAGEKILAAGGTIDGGSQPAPEKEKKKADSKKKAVKDEAPAEEPEAKEPVAEKPAAGKPQGSDEDTDSSPSDE